MLDAQVQEIGKVWDRHHASGRFATHHAFDDVISFAYRYAPKVQTEGRPARVLELGCGSGNNLAFLSEFGLDSVGIDLSPTAVERGRAYARKKGLGFEIRQGSMTDLPFEAGEFDLVVDRKGITVLTVAQGGTALSEAARVLRPGGFLLFTPMSEQDSRFSLSQEVAGYVQADDDFLKASGIAHRGSSFWSLSAIREALAERWRIIELNHIVSTRMDGPARYQVAEWKVIAQRV